MGSSAPASVRSRTAAALLVVLAGFPTACASQDPVTPVEPAGDVESSEREVTLRVAPPADAPLWFQETIQHAWSVGGPEHRSQSTAVVNRLFAVTRVPAEGEAIVLRGKFVRCWGQLDDGSVLPFDSDQGLPVVACRLDDLKSDLAIAGRELEIVVQPDGTPSLREPSSVRTMSDLSAFQLLRSVLGDGVRHGEPMRVEEPWEATQTLPLPEGRVRATLTSHLVQIGTDSVRVRQTGACDAARIARSLGAAKVTSSATLVHDVSRHDGLVLRSEGVHATLLQFDAASGAGMNHTRTTRLERVPAPPEK